MTATSNTNLNQELRVVEVRNNSKTTLLMRVIQVTESGNTFIEIEDYDKITWSEQVEGKYDSWDYFEPNRICNIRVTKSRW